MNISVSVAPIWRTYGLTVSEIYQKLHAIGFRFVAVDIDESFCLAQHESALRESKLNASYARLMPPKCAEANAFEVYEKAIRNAISFANALKLRHLVVPPIILKDAHREVFYQANFRLLHAVSAFAKQNNVQLLIENAESFMVNSYLHAGIEIQDFLGKLNEENVHVCANLASFGTSDLPMYPHLHLLNHEIQMVEISDNFFANPLARYPERQNMGLAPLMGFLDFDEALQALKENQYQGFINLRMNAPQASWKSPTADKLRVMPLPLTEKFFGWSLEVLQYMLNQYGLLGGENA